MSNKLEILIWDFWIKGEDGFTRFGSLTKDEAEKVCATLLDVTHMGTALVWEC